MRWSANSAVGAKAPPIPSAITASSDSSSATSAPTSRIARLATAARLAAASQLVRGKRSHITSNAALAAPLAITVALASGKEGCTMRSRSNAGATRVNASTRAGIVAVESGACALVRDSTRTAKGSTRPDAGRMPAG